MRWLVGPGPRHPGHLLARWIFLRALGLIFFSAFFSLAFQIRGLNGPDGILPAGEYLRNVSEHLGALDRFWYAPTLLWLGNGPLALKLLWAAGLAASILIVLNLWPRVAVAVCFICFLSFVSTPRISPRINRMACCSLPRSSACSSLLPVYVRGSLKIIRLPEPACFFCNGSGSASTLNPGW